MSLKPRSHNHRCTQCTHRQVPGHCIALGCTIEMQPNAGISDIRHCSATVAGILNAHKRASNTKERMALKVSFQGVDCESISPTQGATHRSVWIVGLYPVFRQIEIFGKTTGAAGTEEFFPGTWYGMVNCSLPLCVYTQMLSSNWGFQD